MFGCLHNLGSGIGIQFIEKILRGVRVAALEIMLLLN